MPPSLLDRFRGCLLGQAVGDALGAPFETMPAEAIYYSFGFAREIVAAPPVDRLEYTDDTQMMIGLAEHLAARGRVEPDGLMAAFVDKFHRARAYGPGTEEIIAAVAAGGNWRSLSATIFPGGSYGNGAAMRAAPVGLLFHQDLDRVEHEAAQSALVTHSHPVGIDGARIFALAIASAMRLSTFHREDFYAELGRRAKTQTFQSALAKAASLTSNDYTGILGTSIEADRSVPTALECFASSPNSYSRALAKAIGLGGDVDTIAAMTGALIGAHLGVQAVPPHLLALLEDGTEGRSHIDLLAHRLHQRHAEGSPSSDS